MLKLSTPTILAYADFRKPFNVHTDAPTEGLGAVLYQEHDGLERVILMPAEVSVTVKSITQHINWNFSASNGLLQRNFIYGNEFLVCTDNNPLTYVLSSAKLDATGHRWLAALGTYNFTLKYKSGKSNGDADGLSRRPQEKVEVFPEAVKAICQAYTVSCPYVEIVLVTDNPDIVENFDFNIESSDRSTVDWKKKRTKK